MVAALTPMMRDRPEVSPSARSLAAISTLIGRAHILAAELHASGLGAGPPLSRAGFNQSSLELSQTTEHSQHETAMRRCGIGPGVRQGAEGRTPFAEFSQHAEKVPCGPRQPVEVPV
mgnify:CR=1 FL=1